MNYILIAAGVAIAILTGICAFLFNQNEELNKAIAIEQGNVARLSDEIKEQNQTILRLEVQRATDQAKVTALSDKVNAVQELKERANAELNSYRDRLGKAANARPKYVGRRASSATAGVMRDFFEASGGREENQRDKAVPSTKSSTDNSTSPKGGGINTTGNSGPK